MTAYELLHAARGYFEAEKALATALDSAVSSPGYFCQHLYQARADAEKQFDDALNAYIDARLAAAGGQP